MFLLLAFTLTSNAQEEQYGLASYYADAFQGKKAASGIKYDKNKLTCAHNDYPFGSTLKVTHLENKKSVTVKVIDRGPYIQGRIVDLSRAAAQRIGLINDGIAQVKVELVKDGGKDKLTSKGDDTSTSSTSSTRRSKEEKFKTDTARTESRGGSAKTTKVKKTPPSTTPSTTTSRGGEAKVATQKKEKKTETPSDYGNEIEVPTVAAQMMTAKDFEDTDLYQISLIKPKKEGYGVQVISLSDYESVLKKVAELQGRHFKNILIKTVNVESKTSSQKSYKIILGQFETLEAAKNYQKNLKKKKKISGFVVPLGEVTEDEKK